MFSIAVDKAVLTEIVQRLVRAVDPDRIVLFGSRARGDAASDSDLDLLLIKTSEEPPHRRAIPAYRALSGLDIPLDIVWYTQQEVEDWSRVPNHVVTQALREGQILYEKQR